MLLVGEGLKKMIEFKNISKNFKSGIFNTKVFSAVNNVSFAIKEGQITSLIGESGSGKSTIGKLILKLLGPTSGNIIYNGKDVTDLKRNSLKDYYASVQGVFQDPFSSFNPIFKADRVFKVIHAVYFESISHEEWEARVKSVLESVGLNPKRVLGKYPHEMSGGQLQRILISRALLLNVKFLVADEIISMLDSSTKVDVLNLLRELKDRGLSTLFITHDLQLGYYISDSVIILYKGRIVEMGDAKKIFSNPQHAYTKMLFDAVPRIDKRWDSDTNNQKANIAEHAHGSVKLVEVCKNHYVEM
jgi:peptide/nickel transport system ATP-binding protein